MQISEHRCRDCVRRGPASIQRPSFLASFVSRGEGVSANLGLTSLRGRMRTSAAGYCTIFFTFLYNVRTAFLLHVCLVCEPLDAFTVCIHVGILEYIDDHDDLVVSRERVNAYSKADDFLTINVRWLDAIGQYRNPQDVRSGLYGWCRRCICKPNGCPRSEQSMAGGASVPLPWSDPSSAP